MATRYIQKSTAPIGQGATSLVPPNVAEIGVDESGSTPLLKFNPDGTVRTVVTTDQTQTLTNKTISAATLTGNISGDVKFCTTEFDATSGTTGTTLTNVVGMSTTVVPGTYSFTVRLPGVATANSGIKAAFKYTTTALTSLEATARTYTAAAVAVQHTTTATDQASLIASTTASIYTEITGRMVVATGGTVQLQAAQNASHADTTSVYVGASMAFTRTA